MEWSLDVGLCLSLCLFQVVMHGSKKPVEVDEVEDLSQLE